MRIFGTERVVKKYEVGKASTNDSGRFLEGGEVGMCGDLIRNISVARARILLARFGYRAFKSAVANTSKI